MKLRTSVIVVCLAAVLAAFFSGFMVARTEGIASAQARAAGETAPAPPGTPPQPTPSRMRVPSPRSFGPVAVSAAGNYVYVVYDATLHQFDASGLKLVKKAPLYEEEKAE